MSETKETPNSDSLTLVKQAMIKVGSMALENRGKMLKDGQVDNVYRFFMAATAYLCEQNSALTLKYLMLNHPSQFTKFFIIASQKPPDDVFKRSLIWGEHSYAITQDIQGKWFGFSPANYGIPDPNPMTTIFQGTSLKEVVNQISEIEGGMYPDLNKIESLLPKLSQQEVYTLQNDKVGSFFTSTYNFNVSEISRLKRPDQAQLRENIIKLQDKLRKI